MPGEAVFVDLAEVEDLDVGQGPAAVGVEHVVVGQPRQGLAPPGGVAQPADDRGERQDRRPGLQRGPLDAPDRMPREGPASSRRTIQTTSGTSQDRARAARSAGASTNRSRTGRGVRDSTSRPAGGSRGTPGPAAASIAADVTRPSIQSARPPGGSNVRGSRPTTSQSRSGTSDDHRRHLLDERQARAATPDQRPATAGRSARAAPSRTPAAVAAQSRRPGVSVPAMWPSP